MDRMDRTITVVADVYADGNESEPTATYTQVYDSALVTLAFAMTHMRGILFENGWCPDTSVVFSVTDSAGAVE